MTRDDKASEAYRELGSTPPFALFDRLVRRLVGTAPDIGSWQYLSAVAGALTILVAMVAAVLRTLGLFVHRAREGLVGAPGLSYPEHELLLTGFDALWQSLWWALSALVSDHGVLHGSAWGLLALSVGLMLGSGWVRRSRVGRREVLLLVVATGLVLTLLAAASFATIALQARNFAGEVSGDRGFCTAELSGNWADMVAYESCSWLTNETRTNEARRQSLSGLLPWLLAATLTLALAVRRVGEGRRRGEGWRRWRIGLFLLCAGVALLVLRLWPLAHAYGHWGLSYPEVAIVSDGDCRGSSGLAEAVEKGSCCAYDISASATSFTLLLRGAGCPQGAGTIEWSARSQCVVTRPGGPRVVVQGCG